MNEIIVYIACGIIGLFAIFGLVMLITLVIISANASVKAFRHKKAVYVDMQNEYNIKLASHKKQNLTVLLEKECEIDDEITAKKLEKYSKHKKKHTGEGM